jgi:hypothetical protein
MPDQPSNALPSFRYRDPADVVEFDQMDTLGCRLCTKHSIVLTKSTCSEEKNAIQKGVPIIGHKCRWFVEKA